METQFNLLIANFNEAKANEFTSLYASAKSDIQREKAIEVIVEYLEQMYSEYNSRHDYGQYDSYQ